MKKFISFILLGSALFAGALYDQEEIVPTDESFVISTPTKIFDTNISYTHKALLSCTPKIDAVYKVESAIKLRVIPRKALRSGVRYNCEYKDQSISFKAADLEVAEAQYFEYDKNVRIVFSNEIDTSSIPAGVEIQRVDKLSKTKLKYSLVQHGDNKILLHIDEPVGSAKISIKVNKKLRSIYGSTLLDEFETTYDTVVESDTLDKQRSKMVIYDKPQFLSLDDGKFVLRIFSYSRLQGKVKKHISIEGISEFTVRKSEYLEHKSRYHGSRYYTDIHSNQFQPKSSYKITLHKGLKSYKELKEDKSYTLKSKNYKKFISFRTGVNYISNLAELGFSSVNIDNATLIVEKVLDDNIRYFMNYHSSSVDEMKMLSKEILNKKIILNNPENKISEQKISLRSIEDKMPHGVYKIAMHYEVPSESLNHTTTYEVSTILFVSDLGISVDLAKEQAFVTVLSLSHAKPIADAKVELYSDKNELIATADTNSDGVAIIEQKGLLKNNLKGIVVRHKDDSNFLTLSNNIKTPTPGWIQNIRPRSSAYIYFQSNILRPEATLHTLISIKDQEFISADRLPIKLILTHESGKVIDKQVYHTDAFGVIEYTYKLKDTDKTGEYTLDILMGDENIGSKSFQVESFMPPKIESSIHMNKSSYYASEMMELNITTSYLFGAPASNLNGSVSVSATPVEFRDSRYKEYSFVNRELRDENTQTYLEHKENFKLDKRGKAKIILSSRLAQSVPSILEAMIGATVIDDAQPLSKYTKVKIFPYRAMVGLKLDKESYGSSEKLKGRVILIDPVVGSKISRKLYAVIKKHTRYYTLSSGNVDWESEASMVGNFIIDSNGEFEYDSLEDGEYTIEVFDHLGGHSASQKFEVWNHAYSNISTSNDLKSVEIDFADKLYKKGDELNITIKSPILEGEMILTLESDKVELYRRVELHKGVAKLSIPIDMEVGRGLYVHAVVVRASDVSSRLIPFRVIGRKLLKADRTTHKINIEIKSPKISKSKRALNLQIHTDKPSEVLISIVDRGILQLVKQQKPNPFEFFDQASEEMVSYYDLYDQLASYIAKGDLVDFGADEDIDGKKKHLAPDLGKRIKPFMLWSGIVDLRSGDANLSIDIPEYNGRASIAAIAIGADAIGSSQQDIIIKDDIMIKPAYPKYALVGDKIVVPLRVFNTTQKYKDINISVESSDNLTFTLERTRLKIAPKSSTIIKATLLPKKVGKGTIILSTHDDGEFISKSVELPVYSQYTISTHTFKAISKETKSFKVPKEYKDAKVIISLSDNIMGAFRDELRYLVGYPYGCAEQTASKISAIHYSKEFLSKDKLLKESDKMIEAGIDKLYTMQNDFGEFSYWQDEGYIDPYASLYATQTIFELHRDGVKVPKELLKKSADMLHNVVMQNSNYLMGKYTNHHRVFAAFILAEDNKLKKSEANMLWENKIYKKNTLSMYYMGAIMKMQNKPKLAKKMQDYAKKTTQHYKKGDFGSINRDAFLMVDVITGYMNGISETAYLEYIQNNFGKLYSTQDKAVALRSISRYIGKSKDADMDVVIDINGEKKHYSKSETITIDKLTSDTITVSSKDKIVGYTIELVKHLPKTIKNELSGDKDINIRRLFVNPNGEYIDPRNIIQGDKIYSKIIVKSHDNIKNVVVDQRIPACLSIVNNSISGKKEKLPNKNIDQTYKEIRDDRVLNFINLRKDKKGVIYTPLVATMQGECSLPAVIIEAMYDTRIHDYAKASNSIRVKAFGSARDSGRRFTDIAKNMAIDFYHKEMTATDPTDLVGYFYYPVAKYFDQKGASKKFIHQNKEQFFHKWPVREYSNIKTEVLDNTRTFAKIKVTFDYILKNNKGQSKKGKSNQILSIAKIEGRAYITRVDQIGYIKISKARE